MLRVSVFFACLWGCLAISKLEWSDCGGSNALVKFTAMDITPMPFRIPGKIRLTLKVASTRPVGDAALEIKIQKGNLGGRFWWDAPCTPVGTFQDLGKAYFGSCQYTSTCDFPLIKKWTTDNSCPAAFARNNIECKCPLPPSSLNLANDEVDLSDLVQYVPDWLVAGDYAVEATLREKGAAVGCLKLKVSINVNPPCPELLAKLNACPK